MEGDCIWPPVCHPSMAAEPQQGSVAIGKLIEPAVFMKRKKKASITGFPLSSPPGWKIGGNQYSRKEETCNIEPQVKGEKKKHFFDKRPPCGNVMLEFVWSSYCYTVEVVC